MVIYHLFAFSFSFSPPIPLRSGCRHLPECHTSSLCVWLLKNIFSANFGPDLRTSFCSHMSLYVHVCPHKDIQGNKKLEFSDLDFSCFNFFKNLYRFFLKIISHKKNFPQCIALIHSLVIEEIFFSAPKGGSPKEIIMNNIKIILFAAIEIECHPSTSFRPRNDKLVIYL